jgi:hypothetical protein
VSEINLNPANDEIPYALDGLNIEEGQLGQAGTLLTRFVEVGSVLIAEYPDVKDPTGLLAEAVRKFGLMDNSGG